MRCSPQTIVLAALAFVVGAVLALPMLLVRKAEAGAPPKLETSSEAGWSRAVDGDEPGWHGTDPDADRNESGCSAPPATSCMQPRLVDTGSPGMPLQVFSSTPTGLPAWRLDRLAYVPLAIAEPPWPDPHSIDRQRRYHLRP